jgi:hypothetical protein
MVENKRAWIRMLEATIAIMLVSSVLVIVYVRNPRSDGFTIEELIFNMQRKILSDFSSNPELRENVLKVGGIGGESAFSELESYADKFITDEFGFLLLVCPLGDVCKMDSSTFTQTREKNVYVEEVIISADFSEGYNPKRVLLFVWEI